MKTNFQERRVKPKCYKRTILLRFFATFSIEILLLNVFLPICNNFSEQNDFCKHIFSKVGRLNHSSPMNNTVTNKIILLEQFQNSIGFNTKHKNICLFFSHIDSFIPTFREMCLHVIVWKKHFWYILYKIHHVNICISNIYKNSYKNLFFIFFFTIP